MAAAIDWLYGDAVNALVSTVDGVTVAVRCALLDSILTMDSAVLG
jgi:hypothetical protein